MESYIFYINGLNFIFRFNSITLMHFNELE